MRLSEKEARILACAELEADLGLDAIAKRARVRASAVGYYIRSLEERGVIRRMPVLNINYDGYIYLGIYFSLAPQHKRDPQRLIRYLLDQPIVTWLAETGGEFQYGMALCVKRIEDGHAFLALLTAEFPGLLFEKSLVFQVALQISGRGYLAGTRYRGRPIEVKRAERSFELDELDRRILKAMTGASFASRRQLAAALGTPPPTVDLRIRKLQEAGVICGYIYEVDCARLGMHSYVLLVYGRGVDVSLGAKIFEFAASHPAITQCYECLGSWDYELNVEVSDPRGLTAVAQELYERFGGQLNTIRTLVRISTLKATQVPF